MKHADIVRMREEMMLEDRLSPALKMTNNERWIYVNYEKLPAIYNFCGLINHGEAECYKSYNLENIPGNLVDWAKIPIQGYDEPVHFPFGEWMVAPQFRRENNRGIGMALPRMPALAESQWKKTTGLTRTQHGVSSSNPVKLAESSLYRTRRRLFDNIDDGSNTIAENSGRNHSLVKAE